MCSILALFQNKEKLTYLVITVAFGEFRFLPHPKVQKHTNNSNETQ